MAEPCMCGATDCPSCGPAQGYDVRRGADGRCYNPIPCDRCRRNEVETEDDICNDCQQKICPSCGAYDTGQDPITPLLRYCEHCGHEWATD